MRHYRVRGRPAANVARRQTPRASVSVRERRAVPKGAGFHRRALRPAQPAVLCRRCAAPRPPKAVASIKNRAWWHRRACHRNIRNNQPGKRPRGGKGADAAWHTGAPTVCAVRTSVAGAGVSPCVWDALCGAGAPPGLLLAQALACTPAVILRARARNRGGFPDGLSRTPLVLRGSGVARPGSGSYTRARTYAYVAPLQGVCTAWADDLLAPGRSLPGPRCQRRQLKKRRGRNKQRPHPCQKWSPVQDTLST